MRNKSLQKVVSESVIKSGEKLKVKGVERSRAAGRGEETVRTASLSRGADKKLNLLVTASQTAHNGERMAGFGKMWPNKH